MDFNLLPKLESPKRDTHAGFSIVIAMQVSQKTGKELADFLGISRQQLHSMKNTKKINQDRLEQLAQFFEMDVDEFLSLPHQMVSYTLEAFFRQSLSYLSHSKPMTQNEAEDLATDMASLLQKIKLLEAR